MGGDASATARAELVRDFPVCPKSGPWLASCRYCGARRWIASRYGAAESAGRVFRATEQEGGPTMNQRTTWVSYVVGALAILAAVAFVPTDAAAQQTPASKTRCCVIDNGQLACAQLTQDHCSREGGTDIGPGSCSKNPCAPSATTTTGPPTTTTSQPATTTTTTSTTTTSQPATTTTTTSTTTTTQPTTTTTTSTTTTTQPTTTTTTSTTTTT